jgi:hypothetical protein
MHRPQKRGSFEQIRGLAVGTTATSNMKAKAAASGRAAHVGFASADHALYRGLGVRLR